MAKERVGTLRYVGRVHFEQGEFCGIELDQKGGTNNGSVGGIAYFKCKNEHGLFISADRVHPMPTMENPPLHKLDTKYEKSLSRHLVPVSLHILGALPS